MFGATKNEVFIGERLEEIKEAKNNNQAFNQTQVKQGKIGKGEFGSQSPSDRSPNQSRYGKSSKKDNSASPRNSKSKMGSPSKMNSPT